MKNHRKIIHNLEVASRSYANRASNALVNYMQISRPEIKLSKRQIKGIVNDIVRASARLTVSKLIKANKLDN
jgi:hypothetical protein